MSWMLPLIILNPFLWAVTTFVTRRQPRVAFLFSVAGMAFLLTLAIGLVSVVSDGTVVVSQMGNWAAPFGITLVADRLSAVMVLLAAITGLATVVYAEGERRKRGGRDELHTLIHFLIMGVVGAFVTGDIFNLYVWFEVMLISSFGLLALEKTKKQLDGAVKYVALNIVATVLFLMAVGLLYGLTGTLNMAELHLRVAEVERQDLLVVTSVLFIVAFGIKSAIFPLFFWLPASYHTPGFAVSAIFSGLLTKVGVYSLIRTFTLIFVDESGFIQTVLLVAAGATMVAGVLGAASQLEVRRILSFHIVSQIGYMILGLALMTPLAIAGAVFYLVHHIVVKSNLFFISGVIQKLGGSTALNRLGGLSRRYPLVAILFLVPALSLSGIPPLSGFWAKLLVIRASLEAESYLLTFVALAVGMVTLFSMTKIWLGAFWGAPSGERDDDSGASSALSARQKWALLGPIALLATVTVLIGLFVEPIFSYSEAAAAALLDPSDYVNAVLGGES